MFRIAGRDDLAARFRPILRRVLRRLGKAQAEEAAAATADTAGTEAAGDGRQPLNSDHDERLLER